MVKKPTRKDSLPLRLNYLFEEMNKIMDKFTQDTLAIEDAFYRNNVKSAMILRQQGVLSYYQVPKLIYRFMNLRLEIEMSVCGNGAATKEQVSFMVSKILK